MFYIKTHQIDNDEYVIIFNPDIGDIPMDEGNDDFRKYLAWVAAGNTAQEWQPEDAD